MAQDTKECKAIYGPLSLNIEEENVRKPKESIVLYLSALGGKLSVLVDIVKWVYDECRNKLSPDNVNETSINK